MYVEFEKIKDLFCSVLVTLSPLNKLSSAKFLVCFNFQSASILLRVGGNVV